MKKNYIFYFVFFIMMILQISRVDASSTTIVLDNLDFSDNSLNYNLTNGSNYTLLEINDGGVYRLTQNDNNTAVDINIIVEANEDVELILDGVNIQAGSYTEKSVFSSVLVGVAGIAIKGNTNCLMTIADGSTNTITGYTNSSSNSLHHTAAISVENTIASGVVRLASLTIRGENGLDSTGVLNAIGGNQSAGIGADCNRLTGNITIDSGIINATSGEYGAAIGDGDTISGFFGGTGEGYGSTFVWTVGETNSIAKITINGGEIWATAVADTPGIGTADNLYDGQNATVDEWTGLKIEINGGYIVAVGGAQIYNPSAAIGAGSATYISSSNLVINEGTLENPTKILAVTRTDKGSYAVSNQGGDSIPAISSDSTANVLNIKFDNAKKAIDIDFWAEVDGMYEKTTTDDFPNSLLDQMGDVSILGIAVILPDGLYKVTEDTYTVIGEDIELEDGGMVTGEENSDGTVNLREPIEITVPQNITIYENENATFSVEVIKKNEGGVISYQWYSSEDSGATWKAIDGATNNSYSLNNVSKEDSGNLYRCDVTELYEGENLSVSSLAALLKVVDKQYAINVTVNLDSEIYTSVNSNFELYDQNDNFVTNLTNNSGILSASVGEGSYVIYIDDVKTDIEIEVKENNTEFVIDYYTVNIDVIKFDEEDNVKINDSIVISDNLIVLAGTVIRLTPIAGETSGIDEFKVNNIESILNDSYEMSINDTTDFYIEFTAKKYVNNIKVKVDDLEDISVDLPIITLKYNNEIFTLSDSLVNGEYEIILDNNESGKIIDVKQGAAIIDFYTVNLSGDSGTDNVYGAGLYLKGSDILINQTLRNGYDFVGWFEGDSELTSTSEYKIVGINKKYILEAKTIPKEVNEPVINSNNSYYIYGTEDKKKVSIDVQLDNETEVISYQWYMCDENCVSKTEIVGATDSVYYPEENDVNIYNYYCEIVLTRKDNKRSLTTGTNVKMVIEPITPIVNVENKEAYYTGNKIEIDEVTLTNIVKGDELNISYMYCLDQECLELTDLENSGATSRGGAPTDVGTYYVAVLVEENINYNGVREVVKLTINPADVEDNELVGNPITNDSIKIVILTSLLLLIFLIRFILKKVEI